MPQLLLQQWAFIGVCCAKLLAMFSLCWKAYTPFRRIVINNRYDIQQGSALQQQHSKVLLLRWQ
jgi:hypothetical protein